MTRTAKCPCSNPTLHPRTSLQIGITTTTLTRSATSSWVCAIAFGAQTRHTGPKILPTPVGCEKGWPEPPPTTLRCAPLLDSGTARDAECGCARSCLGQFVVDQGTYHAKLTGQIDQARAKARDTKSEHGNAVLATRVYQGGDTSSINAGASMGGDDMERLEGEIADGDARHCFLPTVPP